MKLRGSGIGGTSFLAALLVASAGLLVQAGPSISATHLA